MTTSVSVIIPSFNGAQKLPAILKALTAQTYRSFNAIVVIDGSSDNSYEVAQAYENTLNICIINQENRGRSGAKNAGAFLAEGHLLIFYDDDVIPSIDSIQKHVDFHTQIGGRAILSGNVFEKVGTGAKDIQKYKQFISAKWSNQYPPQITELESDGLFFTAANSSMLKSTFLSLSGFDERLSDAEDYDLCLRAKESGFGVFFDRTNTVQHIDEITCRKYIHRQREYLSAHSLLKKLHPTRRGNRDLGASALANRWRRMFYFLFSFRVWVFLIDRDSLTFLPKRLRFKIYEWVIHSLGLVYPNVAL